MINEDAARQILDNWPGPPEGEHIRPQETSLEQQMNDRRRIQQLAMKDLDAALEMLPELEAGQPNPMLRTSLLSQLEYRGRSEQADQLLAGMLEAMPSLSRPCQTCRTLAKPRVTQVYSTGLRALDLKSWMNFFPPGPT